VLERIRRVTEPDGFLVLGAAETVVGLTDAFKPMTGQRGLYAPNGSPVLAPATAARVTPKLEMPATARLAAAMGVR